MAAKKDGLDCLTWHRLLFTPLMLESTRFMWLLQDAVLRGFSRPVHCQEYTTQLKASDMQKPHAKSL